jgi:hypothetical protein
MRKTSASEWLFPVVLFLGQTHRLISSSLRRGSSVNPVAASLVLAASLFAATSAGAAGTPTVLHAFGGTNAGDEPNALILASDGNFYGTTYLGVGTVFQVKPDGTFTTLFSLPPQNPNRFFYGDYFSSVVEGSDGLLYVTVGGSNSNPNPMIFTISKSGTGFQVVLNSAAYDLQPATDGNLYGSDGNGIFRLSTEGTYTLLSSASSNGFTVESLNKQATDGNFYGICYGNWWHVCRVSTSGQVTSIFDYPTGTNVLIPANGFLTQGLDGFLYGVALGGLGEDIQTIFQPRTCLNALLSRRDTCIALPPRYIKPDDPNSALIPLGRIDNATAWSKE